MTKDEIKNFVCESTGLEEIKIKSNESNIRLTRTTLRQVLKIYDTWNKYINTVTGKNIFMSTLLNDLISLGCCAVSGHPNSPCYLGKMAGSTPVKVVSEHAYNSCQIGCNKVNAFPNPVVFKQRFNI